MTKFEDNLWREVEGKYGPELSDAAGPLHPRSRLRGPVIAGTSLGIVGAGVAVVIVLTAANSSAAFAVTPHRDGTVSVVIRRIEGIRGANRRLAQLGIHARAVQVADGCPAPAARALASVTVMTLARDRHKNWVNAAPGAMNDRIRPAQIPSGRTLVIPAIRTGALVRLVRGRTVRGFVPACLSPAVQVQTGPAGSLKIVACRRGVLPRPGPVAPGQATNATSTDAAPPPATVTQTPAPSATTTDSGTNTTTDSGTATNPGSTTGSAATPSPTPAGPSTIELPPGLLRACRLAAQVATR